MHPEELRCRRRADRLWMLICRAWERGPVGGDPADRELRPHHQEEPEQACGRRAMLGTELEP